MPRSLSPLRRALVRPQLTLCSMTSLLMRWQVFSTRCSSSEMSEPQSDSVSSATCTENTTSPQHQAQDGMSDMEVTTQALTC